MRKIRKIITALILTGCIAAGLCACGSGSNQVSTDNDTATESSTVYQTTFHEVDYNSSISSAIIQKDGFLSILSEVIGDDTPEGVIPEYEGQYSVYADHIYRIGLDGSMTQLTAYVPLSSEPRHDGGKVNSYISCMGQSPDGKLVSINELYETWNEGGEDKGDVRYFLRILDADGSELSSNEIDTTPLDGMFYPWYVTMDANGKILVSCDTDVLIFSADAQLLSDIPCDDGFTGNLITLPDETVYVMISGAGENNTNVLTLVDTEKGSFGESYTVPQNAYTVVRGANEYDLYYTSGSALYGFDLGDTDGTPVLNWLSNDVNSSYILGFIVQEDGTICALCSMNNNDGSGATNEVDVLKRVPSDSVPKKQILTLATSSLDYRIKTQVIRFNRSNATTHINVAEYSTSDRLLTEIMAGNIPDLVDLSSVGEKALAAKNLLEDIYPYIDADSELDRSDFFENILSALEINGALYNVVPAFEIKTLAGAESVVGSEPGWTYEDLYAALETMPEGCSILDVYTVRDTILETGLYMDSDLYYNMKTAECNFMNDSFTKLLQFASRFPAQYIENPYDNSDNASRIASGEQMLITAYLSMLDYIGEYDVMFGGSATFIGYPTTSGTGNLISTNDGLAMTTACADKDAAWQFLRSYYTADYQKSMQYYLPIRKDAFAAKIQKAMEIQYQKNAEGQYLLDENGDKIPVAKTSYFINGEMIEAYALTQAQADKIYDAVTTSTRRISYDDSNIYEIVKEESAAYFAGQKTAEQVENIIQSRVSIYLREQM